MLLISVWLCALGKGIKQIQYYEESGMAIFWPWSSCDHIVVVTTGGGLSPTPPCLLSGLLLRPIQTRGKPEGGTDETRLTWNIWLAIPGQCQVMETSEQAFSDFAVKWYEGLSLAPISILIVGRWSDNGITIYRLASFMSKSNIKITLPFYRHDKTTCHWQAAHQPEC